MCEGEYTCDNLRCNIADFMLNYLRINTTVQNIHFEGNTFKRMMIELNAGPSNIKGFVGEVLN